MAIVKMKRLRMVAMTADREALLRRLQHMGCVEIVQPEADPDDPQWAGLTTHLRQIPRFFLQKLLFLLSRRKGRFLSKTPLYFSPPRLNNRDTEKPKFFRRSEGILYERR